MDFENDLVDAINYKEIKKTAHIAVNRFKSKF